MKKIFFIVAFLFSAFVSFSQVIPKPNPTAVGIGYKRLLADSTIFIPTGGAIPRLGSNNINRRSAIYADTVNKRLWVFYPNDSTWKSVLTDSTKFVPYTGATADVNLGLFDLKTAKLWLYDEPNAGYGSIHLSDGSMHFEDADGHTMFDIEDGFIQIHKDASIQSNLFVSDLTATRNHYLPNASGTLALTSDIPVVTGYVPYTGATQAVNLGAYDLTVNGLTVGKGIGYHNTVVGVGALANSVSSDQNTAIGYSALYSNTSGVYNTAIGGAALFSNTIGRENTAVGLNALLANKVGWDNTAVGFNALLRDSTGYYNTGIGRSALENIKTGSSNTGLGHGAMPSATTGNYNIGIGYLAGLELTTGSDNIIISALTGGNTQHNGITSGSYNTIIGNHVTNLDSTLSNNIILADGQGNIRYRYNGGINTIYGTVNIPGFLQTSNGMDFSQSVQAASLGGRTSLSGYANGLFVANSSTGGGYLVFPSASQPIYTFPASSGTLALTSNLSSYVPYTGATSTLNLGNNNLEINGPSAAPYARVSGNLSSGFISETGGQQAQLNPNGIIITDKQSTPNYTKTLSFRSGVYTGNYGIYVPDASGTLALTSDIPSLSGYVPYTGATTDLGLGSHLLYSSGVVINKVSSSGQSLTLESGSGSSGYLPINGIHLASSNTNKFGITSYSSGIVKGINFNLSAITSSTIRTYNLPDADGTLALTSDLGSYLPLSGGTLTGGLNGTASSFSSTPTFSSSGNITSNNTLNLTVPASSTFYNGGTWTGSNNSNIVTWNGSSSINNGATMAGFISVNRHSFGAAGYTETFSQSTGIRAVAGFQVLQQTGGSNNGTISHGASMFVQGVYPSSLANVTFTNYYGLLMNSLDEWGGVTLSNRWGIYQAGASDNNYFAGKVNIGNNAVTSDALNVTGTGRFTGALLSSNNQNASSWIQVSNNNAGSGAAAGLLMTNNTGDLGAISLLSSTNSPANGLFIRTLSTNSLVLGANGGQNLTIANGGAATFSSSVTAGNGIISTSDGNANAFIARARSLDNIYAQLLFTNNSGTNSNALIGAERIGTDGGGMYFYTKPDGGSWAERMYINSLGNIGLGIRPLTSSSVEQRLTINSSTSGKGLYFASYLNAADQYIPIGMMYAPGNENNKAEMRMAIDNSDGSTRISFHTVSGFGALTERLRITSTGVLGFNGNSAAANANLDKMSMGYLNSSYGWIQTWAATPLTLNPSGNNIIMGTTTDNGVDKLQVSGTIAATSLKLGGDYSNTITSTTGFSSFQTLIPTGVLAANALYIIYVNYSVNGGPYNVTTSFTYIPCNTNGGGVDNTFTPLTTTHQGGTATMDVRSFAGSGQPTAGLQLRINGVNVSTNGSVVVKAIRLQ